MHKTVIIIPARYAASRFPGKSLEKIHDYSIIQHVYQRAILVSNADEVLVATDDVRIQQEIEEIGGKAVMTSKSHNCGTSRIAEVVENLNFDLVINLQGDEPLIDPKAIEFLVNTMHEYNNDIVTLSRIIDDKNEFLDPNVVKVVVDLNGKALYFSRVPIPYCKRPSDLLAFRHIGIYGFKKDILLELVKLPKGKLEELEGLEQLRWLENGYSIKVLDTEYQSISIDTPEDLEKVKSIFEKWGTA